MKDHRIGSSAYEARSGARPAQGEQRRRRSFRGQPLFPLPFSGHIQPWAP
jgi:hypothetical protein